MILTADLHISEQSADIVFGEVLPGIISKSLEYHDLEIGILGDIWHTRYSISASLLLKLYQFFVSHNHNDFYILPGNHDEIDVQGHTSLTIFDALHNVHVCNKPSKTVHGFWLPYRKNKQDLLEGLALFQSWGIDLRDTPLFYHGGILGAELAPAVVDGFEDSLDIPTVNQFKAVLCGHYHKFQNVAMSNIWYVGSPWQTNAREIGNIPGIVRWDGEKIQRIPTNWGPKYRVVEVATIEDLNALGSMDLQDHITIKLAPGADSEKIQKSLSESVFENYTLVPPMEDTEQRLDVAPDASIGDYIGEYLNTIGKEAGFDPKYLAIIFSEIKNAPQGPA